MPGGDILGGNPFFRNSAFTFNPNAFDRADS